MKLKNLILLSTLVMLFTMFLGTTSTYAQWYVDNLNGNDSWDGKQATPAGDGVHGPKKTISGGALGVVGAYLAASAGEVINVANTGTPYMEGPGLEKTGGIVIDKQITFRGYQALNPTVVSNVTIAVSNFTVNITTGTTTCTFDSGTFIFALGQAVAPAPVVAGPYRLYLQAGTLNDASAPITVGHAGWAPYFGATTILIERSAGSVSATGQFNFAGTINYKYSLPSAKTTGNEFVANGGTFNDLTTTGAFTLTVSRAATMTGVLTTSNVLALGSNTLTINGASVAHAVTGNVTSTATGGLVFDMTGNATITGAVTLPNVTAQAAAGNPTLTLTNITGLTGKLLAKDGTRVVGAAIASISGTVTAQNTANITLANNAAGTSIGTGGFTGDEIINSGTGFISFGARTVNGNILLNTQNIIPLAADGGLARIFSTAAVSLTINGSVTNSAAFTFNNDANGFNTDGSLAGLNGIIYFGNIATTITGSVNNQTTFGLNTGVTSVSAFEARWNGLIVFTNNATDLTINGSLTNSSSVTIALTDGGAGLDFDENGGIFFSTSVNGAIRVDNQINNSSNFTGFVPVGGTTNTGNGVIDFDYYHADGTAAFAVATHRTGDIGTTTNRIGDVFNSSKATTAGDNGSIYFGDATTATFDFYGKSINVSGTQIGGTIYFANGTVDLSGNVINSRTDAQAAAIASIKAGFAATNNEKVKVLGYISNTGTSRTEFNTPDIGVAGNAVSVTGKIESTNAGTIIFTNVSTGTSVFGPLNLTDGTIKIPATDAGGISIVNFVGNSTLSGTGLLDLSATIAGGGAVTFSGNTNSLNLVGGTLNTTNRAGIVSNATTLQIGNSATNPTFTGTAMFTVSTPSPVGPVTVNIGSLQPIFPGIFNVASSAGITTSVTIQGGLFQPYSMTLNSLGLTNINNAIIYLNQAGTVLTNNGGYTTSNNGRIVFAGIAQQDIAGTAGVFGDIEINNNHANGVVLGAGLGNFAGTLYLTSGKLDNVPNNFTFDATTAVNPAPSPNVVGVVVNQGTLDQQPNYVAMVNITYVGLDKVTGNELPIAADKLNDLLVATTNGTAGTGQGAVRILQSAVVNGTLTVNAGQYLVIGDGLTLQLKGAANLLGSVANIATGLLVLNGSTVNASGYLPSTQVFNGTNANTITGVKAFIDGLLGADGIVGGAADYIPNVGTGGLANGEILFAGLNGTLSLGVGASPFTTGGNTNLDGITTVGANNNLTLLANLNEAGTVGLNHGAGTIDLGTFTLNTYDATPVFDGAASIIGTGTLAFVGVAPTLTLTTQAGTIAANVNVNTNGGGAFTLAGFPLTISGVLNLTNGSVVLNKDLTLTNQTFNIASTFDGWGGAQTLILNPAVAPMTWNYNIATPNVINVDVRNNVDLAGTVTTLNVTGTLKLISGIFNHNTRNLQIYNGANLSREIGATDGTGTLAGTGMLILNGANVLNGTNTPALSANYVRFDGSATTFDGTAAYGNFTVNNTLDINNNNLVVINSFANSTVDAGVKTKVNVSNTANLANGQNVTISGSSVGNYNGTFAISNLVANTSFDITVVFTTNSTTSAKYQFNLLPNTLNGKFTVASNVTVNWTKGKFDAAPNYVTPINLNLVGYTDADVLDATVWPANMPALVSTLRVLGTLTADVVKLPAAGSRTINSATSLYLTSGVLDINGTTLNLASGINVYRTNNGSIIGNTLVFPGDNNYNLFYQANGGAIASGIELPSVLNNLTIARTVNGVNFATTLGKTVTVNGTLDVKNDVTQVAPFILQANGTINVVRDNAFSLSTVPAFLVNSFIVGGADGQQMTLGGNVQFPNLTVDLQTVVTNPVLNVYGSFTMLPAVNQILTFNNGIINMVDGILYLPRPQGASNSGLGYQITGTGHVVGNVARPGQANDGSVNDGRFVFPTGTAPDLALARKAYYRPITLTFTPSYPLGSPTTFVVNHKSVSPEGTKGFENGLDGGAGVTIGKYPNFYWGITASPAGLSQTQMYDIEMQGSNLGYPYTSYVDLRGLRRLGNSTNNPWLLLTTDGANNSQQIFGTDTTVWVRSTATQGGIVTTESRFTIGIPVIAPGFSVPATSPFTVVPSPEESDAISLPYTVATNLLGGAAPTVTYSLSPAPPAGVAGSIVAPNFTTNTVGGQVSGNFTWTPGYSAAGAYTLTITAQDGGGIATAVYLFTVLDKNRIPVATNVAPAAPKVGEPVTVTFNGTDEDGDAITWNRAFVGDVPSGTVVPAVGPVVGNQYVITFTPNFNDLGKAYTFQATYTDGKIGAPLTRDVTLGAVTMPQNYGDVNRDGQWTSADAIEALRMSVGLTTSYTTPVFTYDQYNYALADVDLIHNVGNVITTYAPAVYGISAWDAYLILMKSINNATVLPVGTAKTFAASGDLKISKPVAKENGIVAVPLTVDNAKNVYTVTFELNFDTKVAEVVGLSNTPKDWLTAYSVENGVVKVVMAGVSSITASNLGELDLRMKNKEARVQISGYATINNLESRTLATMTVGQVPTNFALEQNFPNPFNPSTTIKYQIAEPTKVAISIYSIDGQLVNTLVNDAKDAGYYQVVWNGTNSYGKQVASGMYIYRIDAGNFVSTKKLMLMK